MHSLLCLCTMTFQLKNSFRFLKYCSRVVEIPFQIARVNIIHLRARAGHGFGRAALFRRDYFIIDAPSAVCAAACGPRPG